MAKTYDPIATYTVPSAQASYTFSSIPSTYTDLVLITSGTPASNTTLIMRLNSDTAANYSFTDLTGDGTTISSGKVSGATSIYIGDFAAATMNNAIIQLQNYSNTVTYKTILRHNNSPAYSISAAVALWRKTPEAINAITFSTFTGVNIAANTTFTLYGIKAA